jgi:hypothetical protein
VEGFDGIVTWVSILYLPLEEYYIKLIKYIDSEERKNLLNGLQALARAASVPAES